MRDYDIIDSIRKSKMMYKRLPQYIDSLGGQLQAWFVRMGRVAKPETLSTLTLHRAYKVVLTEVPRCIKILVYT